MSTDVAANLTVGISNRIPTLKEYHTILTNIVDDEEYDITTNHRAINLDYYIDMSEWRMVRPLNKTDDEMADVYVVADENGENNVIAKYSEKNLIRHELAIGYAINCLNMREFCRTYGVIEAKELGIDKPGNAICLERVVGTPFSRFIEMEEVPDKEIVAVVCRILVALQRAYELIGFTHYDLHLNNIMICETDYGEIVSTRKDNYKFKIYYLPVIIDYEFSTIKIKNKTIGISGIELKGIFNTSNPSSDIHMLLCDCIRVRPSLTKYLRYGIQSILNIDSSLSNLEFRKMLVSCPHALYDNVERKFSQIEYWPFRLTTNYEDAAVSILDNCDIEFVKRTSELFD